jgi:DHA2 family multidrug resistance protein
MTTISETPMEALPAPGNPAVVKGWLLLSGITLAALAEAIASTVLSTGRLDMIGDTHATPDEFAWLDVGYTAAKFIAFFLTPWLISKLSGTVTVRAATGLLTLACGLAAATANTDLLVALRILQGAAGGVLLVSGQTALFQIFPKRRQPFVQALFAVGAVVAPAAFIPLTSGWTIDSLSWTWIFMGALVVGLIALALVVAGSTIEYETSSVKLDWAGLALLSIAAVSLSYVLNQGSRWNWFDESRIIILSLAGMVALALFIALQFGARKTRLVDLAVFHNQGLAFAFPITFVAGFALTGSAYLIPSFAVSVLGMTPTEAGWLLLPSGFMFAGALLLVATLIAKGMPGIVSVPFGVLIFMTAMWMLSGVSGESGAPDMMPAILLRGLGLGFLFLSLTLLALLGLPRSSLAHGVALFNAGRLAGGLIGTAALQTLIDHQAAQNLTVLAANVTNGRIAVVDRLSQTANLLAARGIEAGSTGKAAVSLLGRQVTMQATVISFDTAFFTVALLFVVATPVVIGYKIALGRFAKRRAG